jgi:hypothetical protein
MQKILIGLAASTLFAASASANNDSSWMQLDGDIASLSSTVVSADGVGVSGYMADWYTNTSDTTPNTGGWKFKSLRLNFKGKVEDMSFKVSTSLKSGTAVLKDAYVKWEVTDGLDLEVGQFKRPFSWNFTTSSSRLLFYDNTMNGENEARDNGFMLSGAFGDDMFGWQAAMTNGDDGTGDNQHYTVRLTADVAGKGGFHKHEGAIDGGDELDASVGVAYATDDSDTTGFDKIGFEGALTVGGFFGAFDVVDWSADAPGTVFDDETGIDLDDTTPWSLTGSYLVSDNVEVAARYEDFDDLASTSRTTVGLNFYQVLPHRAKWMINYQTLTSDTAALEIDVIRLGLVFSF